MANHNGRENSNPAFQFYPTDFWASPKVACMDAMEVGLYLRLLSECFTRNGLPMDLEELDLVAMSLRVDPEDFRRSWDRIFKRCFVEHEGRWWNPRMLRERASSEEFSEERSESGKKGAEARWKKHREEKAKREAELAKNRPSDTENGSAMAEPCTAMAVDGPHPTPPHPVNTLAGVTRARAHEPDTPSPELPPDVARAPDTMQAEYRRWSEAIDRMLASEQVSVAGSRILLDALEYRCAVAERPRDLLLPRMDTDWLTLAKRVDADIPLARDALRSLRDGGFKFTKQLDKAAEDREKAQESKAAQGFREGSLDALRAGVALAANRETILEQARAREHAERLRRRQEREQRRAIS